MPMGSESSSTFNPEGEATSFVNANGQPINYTYNAAGQITHESFSDGSSYTYTYDANDNMLTATDSTGTITFTYDPITELLTDVAYPGGTSSNSPTTRPASALRWSTRPALRRTMPTIPTDDFPG